MNNATSVEGVNDTHANFAELQALTGGSSSYIVMDFGSQYSGHLGIDMYSKSGFNSTVEVYISEDGKTFSSFANFTQLSGSSPSWDSIALAGSNPPQFLNIYNAQYVKIVVVDNSAKSDIFLDAVYIT